ncbi:MAG: alpha/beta hydrolase [Phycisphaerae bacterium]|nr:alpha/beta hydrolase [Gemmatimonadaceae bacterium]
MIRSVLFAALVASLAGVTVVRSSASEQASQVRNVILVHGAYADGSSYAKVIPLLRAKGLNVTAVQNPLTSLAADIAATRRAIALQDGPVILVGHSSAGMVITEAGNDPKVVGLVYISAIIPDDGQSAADAVKGFPPTPGLAEQKPDAGGYLRLTQKGVDEDFVPDLPPAERAMVYAVQGDWNSTFLSEKISTAAWKTKPSWSIIVNDRMVPPEHERAAAKRIKATTTVLTTGHVPMLSNPSAVAAVILDAATKARKVGSP